jgi:hypothetical protein
MVYKKTSKNIRSYKSRCGKSKNIRSRKSRFRKKKKIDGRQNIERPQQNINSNTIDPRMYILEGEVLRHELQNMDQSEYFKFLLDITIEGVFFGKDFITHYEDDLMSATVTTIEDSLSYSIQLINVNRSRLKISILQSGHIFPYVSNFIYRDSIDIISDISNYVNYVIDQLS